jgi:iron complex transport system permease protein
MPPSRGAASQEKSGYSVRHSLTALCCGRAAALIQIRLMKNQVVSSRIANTTFRRTILICGCLLILLLLVFLFASVLGSQRLPLTRSLCALTGTADCGLSPEQQAILFDLRLPRILLAGAVGMCLATAGAGYQALLRNPLAEPYLLGVSNGAAVGTMAALVFFGAYEWSRPLLAFAGALAATFVVYRLARGRTGASPERLILAGVIVTTFLSSASRSGYSGIFRGPRPACF